MRFYSRFRSFTWFDPAFSEEIPWGEPTSLPNPVTTLPTPEMQRINVGSVAPPSAASGWPFPLGTRSEATLPAVAGGVQPPSWRFWDVNPDPKYSSIFFPKIDPVWSSFFDRLHQLVWQNLLGIQWNSPGNRLKKWPFDAIWEWFIWFPESELVGGFNPSEKY